MKQAIGLLTLPLSTQLFAAGAQSPESRYNDAVADRLLSHGLNCTMTSYRRPQTWNRDGGTFRSNKVKEIRRDTDSDFDAIAISDSDAGYTSAFRLDNFDVLTKNRLYYKRDRKGRNVTIFDVNLQTGRGFYKHVFVQSYYPHITKTAQTYTATFKDCRLN